MAISNFVLPTGLEVSGSTVLTGTLDVTDLVNVTTLTASVGVSGTVGNFATLNVNTLSAPSLNLEGDLTVSGNVNLGDGVGGNVVTIGDALTASAGAQIAGGLEVSASNLTVTGDISGSGKLELGGDLTASAMSASGDVVVGGKLSVYGNLEVTGTLTYVNTENLVVTDKKVVIASGSDSANADGAGIYLGYDDGSEAASIYYTHADTSWNTDTSLNVAGQLSASTRVVSLEVTGTTTTGSFAKFGDITGSFVSGTNASFTTLSGALSSSGIAVNDIAAVSYGSYPTNTVVAVAAGGTGSLPTFATARAGAVKYILNASGSSGNHHALEVLVTHSGSTPFYTSYASLYTGTPMIRVTASIATLPVVGNVVTVGAENISGETINVGYLINYVY